MIPLGDEMKKTERIYTMMRFMNNRSFFTLQDLMTTFDISQATAIRDVHEIKDLGLPLTATVGHDGGYSVLTNKVLSPIYFTDDQIKALFIGFMATRNRQLPYLKSRQSIAEKLIGLIPQTQQDELIELNRLLIFEGTNPSKPDLLDLTDFSNPMLDTLLELSLTSRFVRLTTNTETYVGYLIHLLRESGSWYAQLLEFKTKTVIILAISNLMTVATLPTSKQPSQSTIQQWLSDQKKSPYLIYYLDAQAISQHHKYHPFNAQLTYRDPFQNTGMLTLRDITPLEPLINWLLFLGPGAQLIEAPVSVKNALSKHIMMLAKQFN